MLVKVAPGNSRDKKTGNSTSIRKLHLVSKFIYLQTKINIWAPHVDIFPTEELMWMLLKQFAFQTGHAS